MFAYGDAFQREVTVFSCHGDKAEICRAATDIADEKEVAGFDLLTPFGSLIFQPSVKCRLGLFEERDLPQTRLGGGFQGQRACGFIKRGRDCNDSVLQLSVRI